MSRLLSPRPSLWQSSLTITAMPVQIRSRLLSPKIKKHKNISIKTVNVANSWQIESVQDVDKYMAALRAQIIKELDDDTIINIEF